VRPDLEVGDRVVARGDPGEVARVWHDPIHGYLIAVVIDRQPYVPRLYSAHLVERDDVVIFEPDVEW